jgi:uncharacterized membrane protein YfcA
MDVHLLIFVIVGFVAQMIDGALGMAYGVSSTAFLLSIGVPPAAASASVHIAEVFTTGASGLSHWKLGNVDKKMIKKLLIPGIVGGVLGAYVLTSIPGNTIKPFISAYLLIMGVLIIYKIFKRSKPRDVHSKLTPLALVGGFFDAVGGGGWGPIVTTTIVARGHNPRYAVGSVNLSEFFVTVAEAATFITLIGLGHWQVIVGLIIGGVIAAPFAAFMCKKLPSKALLALIGVLIIALSTRTILEVLL